jgi:CRISPR system Cascade subunit CasC
MIQNFAPSNLNRDDTGAPKDCDFGGVRRARISSQCFKRAVREQFDEGRLIALENRAKHSKGFVTKATDRLTEIGKPKEDALRVVQAALRGSGLGLDGCDTEYLLFLGTGEVRYEGKGKPGSFVDLCNAEWDRLLTLADKIEGKGKKESKKACPADLRKSIIKALDGGKAADLALFGRMIADLPDCNIDAASQVAHAISTHKVAMEFDFYTAVDDLQPREETGAGMMGTVEFNSACFYRYANVDVDQLKTNLGGDEGLARRTVEAFLRASVSAIPTGKQNSFAAHNPPAFILAVVRENGAPLSLANAFEKPVSTGRNDGLIEPSIEALDDYWAKCAAMYGKNGIRAIAASRMGEKPHLKMVDKTVPFDGLVKTVMGAIEFTQEAQS